MKFLQNFLGLLLALLISSPVIAQDSTDSSRSQESIIKVSAFVNNKEVPLNRTVTLVIRLSWAGELDRYEIDEFENPVLRNLEIVATASSNRVSGGPTPTAMKEYEFTLKPLELGMAYIEPTVITYSDRVLDQKQRLVTNRLEAKVIEPLPEPGEGNFSLTLIALLLVLIAGGVVGYLIYKKRQSQAEEEAEVTLPLEEQFLQELKESIDLSATDLDIGQAFSDFSRFYRKFLAEKFAIRALENTSDEVVRALKNIVADERFVNSTEDILTTCDLAKFSGAAGDKSELERVYTLIESNLERSLREDLLNSSKEQSDAIEQD